jgi:hypothetical protein
MEPDMRQLVWTGIVIATVLAMGLPAAWAQAPAAPAPAADSPAPEQAAAPRIEFASLAHDFGRAVSGTQLKTSFTFRNAGSATLVIQSVKGG